MSNVIPLPVSYRYSKHVIAALGMLAMGPKLRQVFNAGVSAKLEREGLAKTFSAPSPFDRHKGADIQWLGLTEKGAAACKELFT